MPAARAERFVKQHGLTAEEARFLSSDLEVAGYFEALIREGIAPRTAMHWLTTQLIPAVKERQMELGSFAGDSRPLRRAAQDALERRDQRQRGARGAGAPV